jgi:HSP20 family protein
MVVTRWGPLKDLMALQERMNTLFEETFSRGTRDQEAGIRFPAVDIMEKGDEVSLKVDLPEIDQKAIDIKMEGNTLTIEGERKLEQGTTHEDYYRRERPYGRFSRSFSLPHTVDQEKITASHKDGVLRIVLPTKEDIKPRQIKVEVGE